MFFSFVRGDEGLLVDGFAHDDWDWSSFDHHHRHPEKEIWKERFGSFYPRPWFWIRGSTFLSFGLFINCLSFQKMKSNLDLNRWNNVRVPRPGGEDDDWVMGSIWEIIYITRRCACMKNRCATRSNVDIIHEVFEIQYPPRKNHTKSIFSNKWTQLRQVNRYRVCSARGCCKYEYFLRCRSARKLEMRLRSRESEELKGKENAQHWPEWVSISHLTFAGILNPLGSLFSLRSSLSFSLAYISVEEDTP